MNKEAQRIAIAEACGWKPFLLTNGKPTTPPRWQHPNTEWVHTLGTMPNYLEDLNAMHEAEKVIRFEQWIAYVKALALTGVQEQKGVAHATAAQRAEAFLRTMKLWRE